MSLEIRAEKILFLAREMRLAFAMAKFAPTDFEARTLVRHVIVRAESFVEHARALRKPIQQAGFSVKKFHATKEAYAKLFEEYLETARNRLGAHVQDLDFGERIALWNDIEVSKSEFFADGAVEIYKLLVGLAVPGCPLYADFPVLADPDFRAALAAYQASGSDKIRVELGMDPLALTRPNTTAMLNTSPVHARAGQIALVHRWTKIGLDQLDRFAAFPDVVRLLRARLVTDVVSGCDCLITRQLQAGAPQKMDGLDALLAAQNISPNSIRDFAVSFDIDRAVAPLRQVRDKVGAHLEIDEGVDLSSLVQLLDGIDYKRLIDFRASLRRAFEKACMSVLFLRGYQADGQTLSGALGVARPSGIAFDPTGGGGRITPSMDLFVDTDEAFAGKLEDWLGGGDHRGAARSFFYTACTASAAVESYLEMEAFPGGGSRTTQREFRRVHQFLLDRLMHEKDPDRLRDIFELICALSSGYLDLLTEMLMRFTREPASWTSAVAIAYCLGETANWWRTDVRTYLTGLMISPEVMCSVNARVALFKILISTEGIKRINSPKAATRPFSDISMLTQGLRDGAQLIMLIVLASQFCNPRFGIYEKAFEIEYCDMRSQIVALVAKLAPPKASARVADMVRNLVKVHDYAGISAYLFDEFTGAPTESVGHDLVHFTCSGAIVVATYDFAQRNLCCCFQRLGRNDLALEIAADLAMRNPDDIGAQLLRLQIMTCLPEQKANAKQAIDDLKSTYRLDVDQLEVLAHIEVEL